MSITLTLDRTRFDQTLQRLLAGVSDFSDVSPAIAQLLENSVRQNFIDGGRPDKWTASKRAEDQSGQTLVDTARLKNSITSEGDKDSVRVGTNVAYAAAHNFGIDEMITQQVREHVRVVTQAFGKQFGSHGIGTAATVKAHDRKMHMNLPAREFMLIQEEDWDDIHDVITGKLNKLIKGT